MENSFDNDIFHEFTVSKFVEGSKQDGSRWISLPLDEFAQFRDQVIAVQSIAVSTEGLDVACPWLAAWCQRELVGRQHRVVDGLPCSINVLGNPIENKFHGICTPHEKASKWKRDRLPKLLSHNVADFFMSNLQARYLKAKGDILKKGGLRKCCGSNVKVYYADEASREGAVECFLLLPNNTGAPNSPVEDFVLELLENETTCYLMQQCSYQLLDRLCKYGVPIEDSNVSFPPVVQVQHSRIDPIQLYGIVPLDAVRRMFMLCQVLEEQNYVYYVDPKEKTVPAIYVHVPASTAKSFVVSARVRVQIGLSGEAALDDKDFPYNAEFLRHDYRALAMTTVLNCNKDPDLVEENMKDYRGIRSLRFGQSLTFDV